MPAVAATLHVCVLSEVATATTRLRCPCPDRRSRWPLGRRFRAQEVLPTDEDVDATRGEATRGEATRRCQAIAIHALGEYIAYHQWSSQSVPEPSPS
jgi:hypothetical protein